MSCPTAGATTTATRPAAQPKSITAATPNTNESETPAASRPSSGTGKRSARIIAAAKRHRPTAVSAPRCEPASEASAAAKAATPAAQTTATTAASRRGCRLVVTEPSLPVQIEAVEGLQPAAADQDGNQELRRRGRDESRSPLRHPSLPPTKKPDSAILPPPPGRGITRSGERRASRPQGSGRPPRAAGGPMRNGRGTSPGAASA